MISNNNHTNNFNRHNNSILPMYLGDNNSVYPFIYTKDMVMKHLLSISNKIKKEINMRSLQIIRNDVKFSIAGLTELVTIQNQSAEISYQNIKMVPPSKIYRTGGSTKIVRGAQQQSTTNDHVST